MWGLKIATAALCVVALAGCTDPGSNDSSNDPGVGLAGSGGGGGGPKLYDVTYLVGGSASSASLTYSTPSGTEQRSHARIPVSTLNFQFPGSGFLYISAQNNGGGTVSCTISVNGITVAHNVAHGQYAIAQCSPN